MFTKLTQSILIGMLLLSQVSLAQIVISGNGQLLRYNNADIRLGGNWSNNASGAGYTGVNATGGVVFAGSSAQLINGTKVTTFQNFGISNTAGVSTVGLDINMVGLTFFDGILTVPAGFKVNMPDGGIATAGKTTSFVNGTISKTGNDAFTFEVGDGTKYAPIGIAAPGNVTDVFQATYINSPAPDGGNIPANIELVSGFEYWDLQRTNGSSNVNVTLHWKNSQESEIGVGLTNLFIVHHNGVNTWDLATNGGTSGSGDLNSAQAGSITGVGPYATYGYFTFGSDNSTLTPLPVELTYFKATQNKYTIDILWATASETNNDFFTIEKSKDGVNWQYVETIEGLGNSTSLTSYEAFDLNPFSGISYYRLTQTDFDGTATYSDIISVRLKENPREVIIYPNPTSGTINIEANQLDLDQLKIINAFGQEVTSVINTVARSTNKLSLDMSQVPTGLYVIITLAKGI